MEILKFKVGDHLRMKKKHPCGGFTFTVLRGGTDVKIKCVTCLRELTLEREAIEKMIRTVIPME